MERKFKKRETVREQEAQRDRERTRRQRMGRQRRANLQVLKMLVPVLLILLLVGIFVIRRITPTKERMSLYEYFNVKEDTPVVLIILNKNMDTATGIMKNDVLYVPQSWVEESLNKRFYWDAESNGILYTDDSNIFTYTEGSREYRDDQGNTMTTDNPVLIQEESGYYLDFSYVAARTDCEYQFCEEPARLVVDTETGELPYVTVTKKAAVRYRGGIKSDVLEKVEKGDRLFYRKTVDEWVEVQTPTGITGYIEANKVSDVEQIARQSIQLTEFASIHRDYIISLVWFQVMSKEGNENLSGMLAGVSGINVVSPTWYAITDNSGNMDCFATANTVSLIKSRGCEVWPLVNDFADGVDTQKLFGSLQTRSKMIERLMADADRYGYDGINLDMENVSKEGAKDYLQFVRELSVACQRRGLVLSADNYKAESYNAHYDLAEQAAYADYIIHMGYDEHYTGSESGSVASVDFVEDGIQKALQYVPKEKLVVAMPFYTRIWTEKEGKTTSKAVGMQTAIDDLSSNNAPAIWDDVSGQYFGSYEKDGATVKIWIEEERSIEEKLKLFQQYDLGGVAAWKLGLERKTVWNVISKYVAE